MSRFALVVALAATCAVLACREAPREEALPAVARPDLPHVVLLSIDTLRADHLGCYGYERDTSPVLDRLARRPTLYTDA